MAEAGFQVPLLVQSNHLYDPDLNQVVDNSTEASQQEATLQRSIYGEEEDPEDEKEIDRMEFYCFLFICMIFFFVVAGAIEKYKPKFGH